MPRRAEERRILWVPMTELEGAVVDEMRRMVGASSEANLVRTALWNLADDLDLDPPLGVFDLRVRRWRNTRRRTKRPGVGVKTVIARAKARAPAADHPWRAPFDLRSRARGDEEDSGT